MFLIHAVGGTVSPYAPLSQELADAFTVYGLQSPALSGEPVPGSLAAIVGDYTRRIRDASPAGPYRLAGWSMGGVLAFEIARRLEGDGAIVELLVLLDAPFAVPAGHVRDDAELAGRFTADAMHSLGLDAAAAPAPVTASAAGQLSWLAGQLADGDDASRPALAAQLEQRFRLFAAHSQMMAGYQAPSPGVRAPALVVSAARSLNAPMAAQWQRLLGSGPAAVVQVDSDHYAFLRPPLVADVGATIRKWQAGCQEDSTDDG
jgi:thioesterase domain-containing protein